MSVGHGRPQLPAELRSERKRNLAALIQLVARHWALTQEESSDRMAMPGITRLEQAVCQQINRACEGDIQALKYMLEIMVGKIPEMDLEELTDEDLRILQRAKEIMASKNAKGVT